MKRMALAAATCWLALAAWAAPTDPERRNSLVPQSVAWHTLMALPLLPDQPLPFDAADLLDRHGLAAEGRQLRRALLLEYLLRGAGRAPPGVRRLRDAWDAGRSASSAALHAAFEAYLTARLSAAPRPNEAHIVGPAGWQPLGDRFGLWSDPARRRVAAFLHVQHNGDMHLPARGLRLHLAAGEHSLALTCSQVHGGSTLPPGQLRAWDCEAELPDVTVMKALRAADRLEPRWRAPATADDPAAIDERVRALAAVFTPGVAALAERVERCGAALRCDQAVGRASRPAATAALPCAPTAACDANASPPAPPPRPAAPQPARPEPVFVSAEPARDEGAMRHAAPLGERLVGALINPFSAVGVFLLALAAYVVIRRATGPWPAGLAVIGTGLLMGMAIVVGMPRGGNWEGLLWLFALGAVGSGTLVLISVGPAVYRSYFMTRRSRPLP